MSWLNAALQSSVGRKFLMGITGLFLCFFLVVHLAGNLLLYVGPEVYDEYAHKLHSNPEFLILAEILLYSAFLVHILLSISLAFTNTAAREQDYAVKRTKVPGRILNVLGMTPDNTMAVTGLVVFLFLIVHLGDFKFESSWGNALDGLEPYAKAHTHDKIAVSGVWSDRGCRFWKYSGACPSAESALGRESGQAGSCN